MSSQLLLLDLRAKFYLSKISEFVPQCDVAYYYMYYLQMSTGWKHARAKQSLVVWLASEVKFNFTIICPWMGREIFEQTQW